jgi:hypothetical protein
LLLCFVLQSKQVIISSLEDVVLLYQHSGIIVPFGQPWANHQQARAWAREVLAGEV